MREVVIGTRGSQLALWQSRTVEKMLRSAHPDLSVRLEIIKTVGDEILDVALSKIGDKGLFTKELEKAILGGQVHLAVHSLKDMQSVLPEGLTLGCITERHAPEDALIAPSGMTLETLPHGATVATGSLRRRSQLLHLRPDFTIVDVRGNVNTRLEKYYSNGWDGMILARAGVERLGLDEHIAQIIPTDIMLPAVGQGALGVEIRSNDPEMLELVQALEHTPTRYRVTAERALLKTLEGGCQVPIAGHATLDGGMLRLDAFVGSLDGTNVLANHITGPVASAEELGIALATKMLEAGGSELLHGVRSENA